MGKPNNTKAGSWMLLPLGAAMGSIFTVVAKDSTSRAINNTGSVTTAVFSLIVAVWFLSFWILLFRRMRAEWAIRVSDDGIEFRLAKAWLISPVEHFLAKSDISAYLLGPSTLSGREEWTLNLLGTGDRCLFLVPTISPEVATPSEIRTVLTKYGYMDRREGVQTSFQQRRQPSEPPFTPFHVTLRMGLLPFIYYSPESLPKATEHVRAAELARPWVPTYGPLPRVSRKGRAPYAALIALLILLILFFMVVFAVGMTQATSQWPSSTSPWPSMSKPVAIGMAVGGMALGIASVIGVFWVIHRLRLLRYPAYKDDSKLGGSNFLKGLANWRR